MSTCMRICEYPPCVTALTDSVYSAATKPGMDRVTVASFVTGSRVPAESARDPKALAGTEVNTYSARERHNTGGHDTTLNKRSAM